MTRAPVRAAAVDAAWGHGLLPTQAYEAWRARCPRTAERMASYGSYASYSGYSYTYGGGEVARCHLSEKKAASAS